jgi:pimeloyl-ACP methyl ester carboxylesterase
LRTARPGRGPFVPKSVRQPAATLEKEFFPADLPTILLVHGFWGGAAHWGKVILGLSRKGHQSICAVENTSLADDAERTRKMIAQQKGPVLLVGHSYGAAVITEAGDMPNVVGLVYIAAFAPDAGESPGGITAKNPPVAVPNMAPDSDGYLWNKSDKFHASFCQDLTANEALVMAVTQNAPVASTFENPLTAPAWKRKPSWYQISSDDRMIAPANQEWMSGRLGARKVIKLKASHASLASMPEEVSALIDEAASAA